MTRTSWTACMLLPKQVTSFVCLLTCYQKQTTSVCLFTSRDLNKPLLVFICLQSIPMFLPIMRATLNLPAARDPEVLERLDPIPLQKFCVRYQTHLTTCANLVATEQNALTQKIREMDGEITKIINAAYDKQKRFAKYAEKLSKVQEVSHQLNRCHMFLNQTLESIETLNNQLEIEDRLEPFVWTTG